MPKLILRCNYLKNAPVSHLSNFINYIGTREGVEKVSSTTGLLPATVKQQELIQDILNKIEDAAKLHEYHDYLQKPTRENASEFITQALEYNMDIVAKKKNYMDYLANRPGAEQIGSHGLFSVAGESIVLSKVQEEVGNHQGVIWTNVVSLRREDAERLGYDSAAQWQELIRSRMQLFAENYKIDITHLKWYAAFHNESHQKITTDTTEFKYYEVDAKGHMTIQKLYLDPFMDMFNSEILSYGIDKKPSAQNIMSALNKTIEITADCPYRRTFHSDRGWAYQMKSYSNTLKSNRIYQSMSRKGNCYDNSIMENFFEGFVYLTSVMDLYSRKIIAWELSDTLEAVHVVKCIEAAKSKRNIEKPLIFHTDRGCQYVSEVFRNATAEMINSYSKKAYPWDNACIESFHALLKREWISRFKIFNFKHAYRLIFEYIETFYNTVRIHSHCGYLSPDQYEEQYLTQIVLFSTLIDASFFTLNGADVA